MPDDAMAEFPSTATVTSAAGGHLTAVAYGWRHPEDGPQEGLLTIGSTGDGSPVVLWGDSWHQQPAAMTLTGQPGADETVVVEGNYGEGWRWLIGLDATDPEQLRLWMKNAVPGDLVPEGKSSEPYPVMEMTLRRA